VEVGREDEEEEGRGGVWVSAAALLRRRKKRRETSRATLTDHLFPCKREGGREGERDREVREVIKYG